MLDHTLAQNEAFRIRDLATLQAWSRRLCTTVFPHRLPLVKFDLSNHSVRRNESLSALANGWTNACGCASGGFFMTVAVVAMIWSFVASGGGLADISISHVGVFVGVFLAATAFGKLLGLLWARFRLLQLARRTSASLRT